ncbi:MAG: alpha/beta fold hydrolase [bacterium]|nr:alpha/beta fold hydrolase [bacterium]
MLKKLVLLAFLALAVVVIVAQEAPIKQEIELEASDGLILKGDFYPQEEASVGVLLLHMNGGTKRQWTAFIPKLQEAGYSILTVDMRGFGSTGGRTDWTLAQEDVQLWLDWLKSQENVSGIALMGGSIGANVALIACANDLDCLTVVALSPGEDYARVQPSNAVSQLDTRSILLVASYGDNFSAYSVTALAEMATGEYAIRMYTGSQHGTGYFVGRDADRKMNMLIDWLDEHTTIVTE